MSVTIKTVAAALAATGLVAGLGATTAAQASTAPTYCVTDGMGSGYAAPAIKPADIYLGADFYVGHARWASWGTTRAVGQGREVVSAGADYPTYRWASRLVLSGVTHHDGRAYFDKLIIEPQGAARQQAIAVTGHANTTLRLVDGGWIQR